MSVESIPNFRRISTHLACAGQPLPEQIEALANAGYELVINLARPDSPGALPDEAARVAAAGMDYIHIPVDFARPTQADFDRFCAALDANGGRKVLSHCAYNWRASSFVYLYRVTRTGLPSHVAEQDLKAVWQPDAVWQSFIDTILRDASVRERP